MTTRLKQIAVLLAMAFITTTAWGEGNVQVMQSGGSLFITGDDTANGIQVGQFTNGDFFVTGIECHGGGTSINYGDYGDYEVYSGVHNIFINTKRGDDCIAVTTDLWRLAACLGFDDIPDNGTPEFSDYDLADTIYLPGKMIVNSSGGWDAVGIGWFESGGTTEVHLGYGYDLLGICHIRTGNNLNIFGHNGEDDILITGEQNYGGDRGGQQSANEIGQTLLVNLGQHDDNLCVEMLRTVNGSIVVDALNGHDNIFFGDCFDGGKGGPTARGTKGPSGFVDVERDLIINGHDGDDDIGLFRTGVRGNMIINAGNGYDDVYVDECFVEKSATFNTGNEGDYLQVYDLQTYRDLIINTVGGDDYVDLYYVGVGRNFVTTLGTGYDYMYVYDMFVDNLFQIGAGNDDDFVEVYYVYCNLLYGFMNSGDDEFTVRDSSASRLLTSGGAGYDCFNDDYNSFGTETILAYEEFDCDDYYDE